MSELKKFKLSFNGTKAQFIAAGHEATYNDYICFIKGADGKGECIYTKGMYFANFTELIAALAYVKGVKVGDQQYNAAQGGGYVAFEASDPATVAVNADSTGIKIGLTPAFIKKVDDVVVLAATINGDYLKAADRTALEQLVANTKSELLGNAETDTKDSKTIEGLRKYVDDKTSGIASEGVVSDLSNRVGVIEGDYLKGEDKTELANRIKAIEDDYLVEADKTELANRITNEAPVTMTEAAGSGDILKTYTFSQNGKEIGRINLAKELVVTAGEIVEEGGVKYLELTIANQEAKVRIAVTDLVDVYSAGDYITIGADNKISVDKAGIIEGLATDANAQQYASKAKGDAIADADAKLANKANKSEVYTKTEADGLLGAKANAADVYSKTEADSLLGAKANAASVYTKTEADSLLGAKANSADVYTKAEVDAAFGWLEL